MLPRAVRDWKLDVFGGEKGGGQGRGGWGAWGLPGEIRLGLMIQLAPMSRAGNYPKSTLAIVLVNRRPVDPGFGFPCAIFIWLSSMACYMK